MTGPHCLDCGAQLQDVSFGVGRYLRCPWTLARTWTDRALRVIRGVGVAVDCGQPFKRNPYMSV